MRIIVVDDTTLFRKLISDLIEEYKDLEVIKRCRDGVVALDAIRQLKPDLITLDLDMPEMNGLELLDSLKEEGLSPGVIVVSAHTTRGGIQTIKALQKGAFDFITKPSGESFDLSREELRKELIPKIRAWDNKGRSSRINKTPVRETKEEVKELKSPVKMKPEVLAIGVSTGGPEALRKLLPQFKADFKIPILIVQHMPPIFTASLAGFLDKECQLHVKESKEGDVVLPGNIYIAPGGRQMKVLNVHGIMKIKLTDDPPEENCKPSVNYLYRSLAINFPGKTLAVILTGMGQDGTRGVQLLKRGGCVTIAQDEETSTVFGMPGSVIEKGYADVVSPLNKIYNSVMSVVQG